MNQNEFLKRVGDNIKQLRLSRGLNAGIIADKLGIPTRSVEGIEDGLVATSLIDIYDIACVLEVEPLELLK
jgi:hypothetical protein